MPSKYLTYTIEDWISDDDFLKYLEGGDSDLSGQMEEILKNPTQVSNIKEAKRLLHSLSNSSIVVPQDKLDLVFENINNEIDQKQDAVPIKKSNLVLIRSLWISGVAAAILLLIIFNPFVSSFSEQYITEVSDQRTIELPDNSIVELNNVSKLVFSKRTWEENRNVKLEGEAFFKVKKGSKFTVESNQGSVSVLGTQFNIYDRAGIYEVECIEGKVRVDLENGDSYILEAGDKLSSLEGKDTIKEEDVVQQIDWINQYVDINEMPISKVIEELERYYNVEFVNKNSLGDLPYTGYFSTEKLDSAIYQIFWPLDINYTLDGNKVIIE